MSEEFKAITTQEDFDKAIQKRLAQKDRELDEKYRDYLAPDKVDALKEAHKKELEELNASLKEANAKIAGFDKEKAGLLDRATKAETSLTKGRIAGKYNIPLELAERLQGETEEELEKGAEAFAGYMGPKHTPPQYTKEPGGAVNDPDAATKAALMALSTALNGNIQ